MASVVLPVPHEEVRAWLARPGAADRLRPPWRLPRLTRRSGLPAASPEDGGSRTRLTSADPEPVLAYQARQVEADVAAHALHPGRLTVAVTGATGFVGSALTDFLTTGGHQVIRLVRGPGQPARPDRRLWDPGRPEPGLLDGVDAVVHLAGAPIGGRFTAAHKQNVLDSRVGPTARLAALATGPTFVCASAVGYYGADRGDEELDEDSGPGDDFLSRVVTDWEAACEPARAAGRRVVNVRLGVVQSPAGGTLRLLRPLFAAGLGGRIGDGRQWLSWIALDDVLDIIWRALADPSLVGPVNAVAPEPVRNAEYAATLARVMRRPALLPTPAIGPRLLLGAEGARELALASQRARPRRLTDAGHGFRFPDLEPALRHVLGR